MQNLITKFFTILKGGFDNRFYGIDKGGSRRNSLSNKNEICTEANEEHKNQIESPDGGNSTYGFSTFLFTKISLKRNCKLNNMEWKYIIYIIIEEYEKINDVTFMTKDTIKEDRGSIKPPLPPGIDLSGNWFYYNFK